MYDEHDDYNCPDCGRRLEFDKRNYECVPPDTSAWYWCDHCRRWYDEPDLAHWQAHLAGLAAVAAYYAGQRTLPGFAP